MLALRTSCLNVGCVRENSLCHTKGSFTMAIGELLEVIEKGFFFFLLTFYFEITVNPHAVKKNNTERFHVHFI